MPRRKTGKVVDRKIAKDMLKEAPKEDVKETKKEVKKQKHYFRVDKVKAKLKEGWKVAGQNNKTSDLVLMEK